MRRIARIMTGMGTTDIYFKEGNIVGAFPNGIEFVIDERACSAEEAVEMLKILYGHEVWELELL